MSATAAPLSFMSSTIRSSVAGALLGLNGFSLFMQAANLCFDCFATGDRGSTRQTHYFAVRRNTCSQGRLRQRVLRQRNTTSRTAKFAAQCCDLARNSVRGEMLLAQTRKNQPRVTRCVPISHIDDDVSNLNEASRGDLVGVRYCGLIRRRRQADRAPR